MTNQMLNLSATIDVKFNGPIAITHYSLTVTNPTPNAVEALYHFALPREGSLMHCEVHMDGHIFSGQVMKRNEASNTHEEAVEQGRRSVLLESMNDGVYGLNVGNLDVGESLTIDMQIASLLSISNCGRAYTYRLPTTIAPRYGTTVNDIEPEYNFFARYPFTSNIALPKSSNVSSSSHAVSMDGDTAVLNGELDRDIFITWEQNSEDHLLCASYRDRAYTLGVVQPYAETHETSSTANRQLHVVLDRSGSMMGSAIQLCRDALRQVINSVDEDTLFNLTSFGSHYTTLFKSAEAMTEQQKTNCLGEIGFIEADMGGTELVPALLHAIRHFPEGDEPKHVLLITDGNMRLRGEEVAAIELLCKKRNVNLHIVGIGYSVNTHALSALHDAIPGTLHTVNPNGELSSTIENIAKLIESNPVNANLKWKNAPSWSILPSTHYPGLSQPVIATSKCTLIDAHDEKQWQPEQVEGEWAQALVHIAAAKHLHSLDTCEATELAEDLGMLSQYTSFVMLDTSDSIVNKEAVPTVIPQMIPPGSISFSLNECHSEYLDIPAFLRAHREDEPMNKLSGEQALESLMQNLLDDLNGRWWRESRWTEARLRELTEDEKLFEEIIDFAEELRIPIHFAVMALLLAHIDHDARFRRLPERIDRRLSRFEIKLATSLRDMAKEKYQQLLSMPAI